MPEFRLQIVVPSVAVGFSRKETIKALRQGAILVARGARSLIRGGGGKGKQHITSKPGEPPANLTGGLAKNIRTSVRQRGLAIVARVLEIAEDPKGRPYGRFLETGAVGSRGGRARSHKRQTYEQRKTAALGRGDIREMEPRPYLSASLERSHAAIQDLLASATQSDIKLTIEKKA